MNILDKLNEPDYIIKHISNDVYTVQARFEEKGILVWKRIP